MPLPARTGDPHLSPREQAGVGGYLYRILRPVRQAQRGSSSLFDLHQRWSGRLLYYLRENLRQCIAWAPTATPKPTPTPRRSPQRHTTVREPLQVEPVV